VPDPNLAGQVWVKGEPKVRLYGSVEATFRALRTLEAGGQTVRITFVHDRQTGNKLFADKVWYVASAGKLSAFLLKSAAEAFAKQQGGSVLAFEAARRVTAD
jgi:NitT/TauT family transport system substrate-binding protein